MKGHPFYLTIDENHVYNAINKEDVSMFYDMLKTRRSIRKYHDKPIEKDKIDYILKSALLAPSSRSRRPWEFIIVTEKDILQKLSKAREHSSSFIAKAPLGVVVIADPEVCDVWIEDTTIASIITQLTAHSIGLGSCWIQVRERMHTEERTAESYIKEVLQIPDKYHVESMIAIGYPMEEKKAYTEEELRLDKLHYEKYYNTV